MGGSFGAFDLMAVCVCVCVCVYTQPGKGD